MKTRYVFLHEPAAAPAVPARRSPGGPGARATATAAAAAAPKVEVDELKPAVAREMLQKKRVAALAPVIPMRLIAPVSERAVADAEASATTAWGLKAVGALSSDFDGSGIVVAVLDTGIDPSHEAFQRAGLELVRRNFTDDTDGDDAHGHGTHCAGTIFGGSVGGKRIGVAPGIGKAMIGKVLGNTGGGSDKIAQAIQWAVDGGAHVISMSLGIDFPGYVAQLQEEGVPPQLATTMALEGYRANILLFERLASFIAARGLMGQPTLLVAAAGNESQRGGDPDFEIAVSPPAVSDGIISVAALGLAGTRYAVATFSNTGARISGPGVDVVSARRGGGLVAMDGTSMATPHVAGVAALWAQDLAERAALNSSNWTARLLGSGRVDALQAGFDPGDVGTGMVFAPQGRG